MPGQTPVLSDERELLLAYIDQQRDGLRYAAFGLTDEQARSTPTASTLSVGGLVKHVAATEQGWIDLVVQRDRGSSCGAGSGIRGRLPAACPTRRWRACSRTTTTSPPRPPR